jgi:acetoin utilization deacetylase AcuC-like enzyme
MLPFRLVYHERYDLNLGAHVFPSKKFKWLHDALIRTNFAAEADFLRPESASDEDILLVHEQEWVTKLKTGVLTYQDILRLEIPYSRQMVEAFWLAAGGTILAAREALRDGIGFNVGGGFHHAFPDHGEGFCAINDIAVGIRRLQQDGLIQRAMVVDCDVHQGNGTAAIFSGDPSVFTLSIHQLHNYPSHKPNSSLDINLPDGVGDSEYCHALESAYRAALDLFKPQLIMFVAGADPYFEDQLGGHCLIRTASLAEPAWRSPAAPWILKAHSPSSIRSSGGRARMGRPPSTGSKSSWSRAPACWTAPGAKSDFAASQ